MRIIQSYLLVLIEADDFDISNYDLADTKIIYIGHHGDKVASKADVILPITAFTEKKSFFSKSGSLDPKITHPRPNSDFPRRSKNIFYEQVHIYTSVEIPPGAQFGAEIPLQSNAKTNQKASRTKDAKKIPR